jgi:hypothetical protein
MNQKPTTMPIKTYCVMASWTIADGDGRLSYTFFIPAESKGQAAQEGKRRIAAQLSPESGWDGQVVVYEQEQFDALRQLGILPSGK